MSWEKLTKKYVWNDAKTPYFVRVASMNQAQAGYEILAYAIFLAVLIWSGVAPKDFMTWGLEVLGAIVALLLLGNVHDKQLRERGFLAPL